MDQYKLFLQKMGLIGTSTFLVTITGIMLLPILTQNLSIQDYGVWTQFQITITIIPAIAILGLPYTMVRFLSASKSREEIQEGFYSILFTVIFASLIGAVVLYILAVPISDILFNRNVGVGLILPLTALMTALYLVFVDYFRASNQMTKYAIFTTAQAYMVVIFALLFVLYGKGVVGAVTGILITQILISLIMFIFVLKQIGFKIPRFHNLRQYLTFGLPTIPSNASFWVLDASDRYIIGIVLGITSVGFYSAGYTISSLLTILTSPIYTVLLPILSQFYAERKIRETRFLLNYAIKLYLIVAVPAVIGLSILAKPLLYILSTPTLANEGYLITPILATGGLFFGLYCIITQIIVMERKTRITGNIWAISAISNIVLDITFGYFLGIIGIAIITLLLYLFAFLITVYYSLNYIRCDFYIGFAKKTIYAAFFMALSLILLNPYGPVNIVLAGLFSFALYMFVLWLLKGIKTDEIKFFTGMIKESLVNVYCALRGL